MKHLVVDISAHGFGHVAQTTAALNALDCRDIRLTVRSWASEALLRSRIRHPFTLVPYQQDHGMSMHDALRVDVAASLAWYEDFHRNYQQRLQQAVRELAVLQADLVFSNVPYLSLEAAHQLGIPSVAMCSLNWADVLQAYCADLPQAGWIHEQILHAYANTQLFLQPTPSMDMHSSIPIQPIAPLAALGKSQPQLRQQLGLSADTALVLVALGGLGMHYPLENWPRLPGVKWVFADSALWMQRDDFIAESQIPCGYVDLLASCDAVITKTGYGTQTEAVLNQVPALCIARPQWPEEPNLPDWHAQQGEVLFTTWQHVQRGEFVEQIAALLQTQWRKTPIKAEGAAQAAAYLQQYL